MFVFLSPIVVDKVKRRPWERSWETSWEAREDINGWDQSQCVELKKGRELKNMRETEEAKSTGLGVECSRN